MGVVVFDLDGTLLRGDSFGAFLVASLRRRPARALVAALAAPLWAPAFATEPTRRVAEAFLVRLAFRGAGESAAHAAAREFAASYARGRWADAGLTQVREHLTAGDRVVVATGSWDALARALLDAAGLRAVPVVGARITWSGSRVDAVHPTRGKAKVEALAAAGYSPPFDAAYSDSAKDLPLLRLARDAVAVDPSARSLKAFRRALGDVPVRRWGLRD